MASRRSNDDGSTVVPSLEISRAARSVGSPTRRARYGLGPVGGGSAVEIYAPAARREALMREHALEPGHGPVRIRWVRDQIWPLLDRDRDGRAPRAAVLLDLLEHDDPRARREAGRSEIVTVSVEGKQFELRRPTLLGAILIKARSIMRHADPDAQREDLLRLPALVGDPRTMAADLERTERAGGCRGCGARWREDRRARRSSPSVQDSERSLARKVVLWEGHARGLTAPFRHD
jgi:hypothetical protein